MFKYGVYKSFYPKLSFCPICNKKIKIGYDILEGSTKEEPTFKKWFIQTCSVNCADFWILQNI
jgi:hypothetical protein